MLRQSDTQRRERIQQQYEKYFILNLGGVDEKFNFPLV
jgi:hypothetical protein